MSMILTYFCVKMNSVKFEIMFLNFVFVFIASVGNCWICLLSIMEVFCCIFCVL